MKNYLLIVEYGWTFFIVNYFFNSWGFFSSFSENVHPRMIGVFYLFKLGVVENHCVIDPPIVGENQIWRVHNFDNVLVEEA